MYIESYLLIAAALIIAYLLFRLSSIKSRLNVALEIYELSQTSKDLSEDNLCSIILYYVNKTTKNLSRAAKNKALLDVANELRGAFLNSYTKPISYNGQQIPVDDAPLDRLNRVLKADIKYSSDYKQINAQIKQAIEKLLVEYE